uniref:Uncharacterized protein n=2 Tax=Kalmanozyma brasiliensis (strain GHG001) TaxID=1365824 RepID=V5ET39_KALBG
MVAFYSNMLWIGLLVFTVLGGIELWQLFSKRDEATQHCQNEVNAKTVKLQGVFGISFDSAQEDACKKLATTSAVVVAVLFGILVLVLMWLIGIVTKYKHQLEERDAADEEYTQKTGVSPSSRVFGNIGRRSTKYQPAETREGDESAFLHTTTAPAGFKNASYERSGYQQV